MKAFVKCATAVVAMALASFALSAQALVNEDGSVTFRYRNETADKVVLDVQFAGRVDMERDANGIWSVTLTPPQPDIYPYCYVVDGRSVMDPLNPSYFPNEGFKNSLLDAGEPGDMIHGARNVPHGSVDYVDYWSDALGAYNHALVYTPAGYDGNPGKRYPVFYLISGTTDTEEVYYKVGRVNFILDNLIAEGRAEEMIVVMPYGNPANLLPPGVRPAVPDTFTSDLLGDLMPYVENNYRTINDADHRAIGGFSRGGNQGLATGLNNLDKFSYLCSYSSFTGMNFPVYENPEGINEAVKLFWLGVGTDDFLYANALDYMDFLDSKGIHNTKVFTHDMFGHTWMNARYFLECSLPLLFKGRYEYGDVVKAPQPTGEGPQRLTAEVMGRYFPAPVISPLCSADGSVTFSLRAADAAKVELEWQLSEEPVPMSRDTNGVWSVTLKPGQADLYPYCFVVSGTRIADPANMYVFAGEGFKYSLIDMRGGVQDLADVPHGRLTHRYMHSSVCGSEIPMCFYTPAGYDPAGSERLPVLCLLHGEGDTHESWAVQGRIGAIMDKLIASGRAQRMIVVMPYLAPYRATLAASDNACAQASCAAETSCAADANAQALSVKAKSEIYSFVKAAYAVPDGEDSWIVLSCPSAGPYSWTGTRDWLENTLPGLFRE